MGSINDVIEVLRQAPSNSERGTLFEQLMVRYFELDPALTQQYDAVWRWIDWPDRKGKPDTGIDLVARERDTGEFTAIQCKFYEPTHTLAKSDIDSFFTASGKKPFTNRVIISTTDKWGKHAEDALEDQQPAVQRISMADIAESNIDWDIAWPDGNLAIDLAPAIKKQPRPYQDVAITDVLNGFAAGNDRGKLIMACGTGKTFTALKLAEQTAHQNGGSARILFLVPSISLLSQTLREWTAQTELDMRAFAVCSDIKVGKLRGEDFKSYDVPIPVTTNAAKLAAEMGKRKRKRAKGLTVVFSTYQSLPAVADAQTAGVDNFDLVICDEAHRTTGVTLSDGEESNFVRIHDPAYIKATNRLYMTATPRIFADSVKEKAEQHSAELVSMDDELTYGPEFHHLSFGDAVASGLLTDYKVLVLTVDESVMAAPIQQQLAMFGEIPNLDDAAKIIGCWNGLAKRAGATPSGTPSFAPGEAPMQRAVAFAKDIKSSKQIADLFPRVVEAYQQSLDQHENDGHEINATNRDLTCDVHHVDGTFNALERNAELGWLKSPVADDECRILTNARCLSEGVDVPALDAVLFLHPRNSIVDVVQSVGRVMRLSPGKDYGYVILPVAVPAGLEPSEALADNVRFKVVWQVLNALRSHDERFDAMVNSIAMNSGDPKAGLGTDRLLGGHVGPTSDDPDESVNVAAKPTQMALFSLSQWQEAIYTRIVDKVGTRVYWDQWAADVADIATRQIARINAILDDPNATTAVLSQFDKFHKGLQDNLNGAVTRDDAISMLSQHLITKPIFDALFAGHEFAARNPVSMVMQGMADALDGSGLSSETAKLDKFYASVRARAEQVVSVEGRQQLIADLYEKFFQTAFKKQSDALGIVYTPVEIVDFILRSVDAVSREHFGRGLTDEGIRILDGFTGTGTFITRLLQSGLIHPADLERKYREELYANEITLLAYYIAAVNIEATYHALAGKTVDKDEYQPFPGIALADTFQISEDGDTLDLDVFPANNERLVRELDSPMDIIVGNPPYSIGQESANDNNANVVYPTLDEKIRSTYLASRKRGGSNSMFDSYVRAFRWASDRIGDHGIVAFVSNGGWIDGNTADGMRLTLAREFSDIYIFNLRGKRISGDEGRKEGRPIFEFGGWRPDGSEIKNATGGSKTTIAIVLLVKVASRAGERARIHYAEVGDYLSAGEKIRAISNAGDFSGLPTREIVPNSRGDWINLRDEEYHGWPAIGEKHDAKQLTVFNSYSRGLETGRDAWVYSYSRDSLTRSCQSTIGFYNQVATRYAAWLDENQLPRTKENRDKFFQNEAHLVNDPRQVSWTLSLKNRLNSGTTVEYDPSRTTISMYRPFSRQNVYFDRALNHILGQLLSIFPTPHHTNVGFYVVGAGSDKPFSALMTNVMPDLALWGSSSGQYFSRWTYELSQDDGTLDFTDVADADQWGYRRVDNITDEILALYRKTIGDQVNKDAIFYYVYGLLHAPDYRTKYAADLKKTLPHIPTPDSAERFELVAGIGQQLADMHVNYEAAEPYPLTVELKPGANLDDRETWRVDKMKYRSKTDRSAIVYNGKVIISGIPDTAHHYMLGSRSGLDWIVDRYQVKVDKSSGIVNDPNDWCDEYDSQTYIIDLIKKVTTVSLKTVELVEQLGIASTTRAR